jgi:hypothetical protein
MLSSVATDIVPFGHKGSLDDGLCTVKIPNGTKVLNTLNHPKPIKGHLGASFSSGFETPDAMKNVWYIAFVGVFMPMDYLPEIRAPIISATPFKS